jgi:hypothetical protein
VVNILRTTVRKNRGENEGFLSRIDGFGSLRVTQSSLGVKRRLFAPQRRHDRDHDETEQLPVEKAIRGWVRQYGQMPDKLAPVAHPKNQSKVSRRPYHEIPNPQVLDAARQFRDGFRLMIQQPPFSGVLLPALQCASIALELYLKSLSAHEVEVPDAISGSVSTIHARASAKSHKLEDLFGQVSPDTQQFIEEAFSRFPRLTRSSSVGKVLEAHNEMFMASRYPFEPGSELSNVEIETLDELLQLFDHVTRKVPHTWVRDGEGKES